MPRPADTAPSIDTGRWVVASASPELFFEWRHGRIVSKPMKGTRRRGLMVADDEQERAQLESSEKDRAENLMIVDMVRNDLGRISRVGTVKVPALFTTEKYDTVWQLTSTVEAEPIAGTSLTDVFEALFPCASITGAPKVSTMGDHRATRDRPREGSIAGRSASAARVPAANRSGPSTSPSGRW